MWMYLGPSCPDRPFSAELGDTKISTQIWGVLAHGADLNFGSNPAPLREGVDNPWVSLLEFTFIYLYQFLLLNAHAFLHTVLGMHAAPYGGSPYLRTWQGRRPTVRMMNDCRYGSKRDGRGVPLGRWLGCRGRTLPLSLNPWELMTRMRNKGR
jgi:hypothetical protein